MPSCVIWEAYAPVRTEQLQAIVRPGAGGSALISGER